MKKEVANMFALLGKILAPVGKVLLKLAKATKVVKTALIGASLVTYSFMFTWQFALIIMLFLFVHEYGHVWAMKRVGIHTKGVYFIPFLGAAAIADKDLGSCRDEVFMALMGPAWGILLALGFCGAYMVSNITLFAGAAVWMFLVTLFNLLPIMPLDGGRVLRCIGVSIHSWGGVVVFVIGLTLVVFFMKQLSGLIFFFLIIGGIEVFVEMLVRTGGVEKAKKCQKILDDLGVKLEPDPCSKGLLRAVSFAEDQADTQIQSMMTENRSVFDLTEYFEKRRLFLRKILLIVDELNVAQQKTVRVLLTRRGTLKALACLVAVAVISLGSMVYMKNIPGADLALSVLEHNPPKHK